MQFDIVLKLLLQQSKTLLSTVAGIVVENWLPTELPRLQNPRLDLLGRAQTGHLIQLELQSTNDPIMPLRMAEYLLAVYRQYGEFPQQILLYVGRESLRMADRLEGPHCSFRFQLVDLRNIDSDALLASVETSDNVLGILTRLANQHKAVERIVYRIAEEKEASRRAFYLEALLLLAGLRGMEEQVEEEARRMPVLNDILENKVLGREYKRGLEEGLQEGMQEGRREGERILVQKLLEDRFGTLPAWATERLKELAENDLANVAIRLFHIRTIEELFRPEN